MKYGVVGDGLVGSVFKGQSDFEVVHRDEWKPVRWDALVNCAGLSSRTLCEQVSYEDVLRGNVWLPLEMFEAIQTMETPVPFIQFSSCSVYKHPIDPHVPLDENAPMFPLHIYNASKILMEYCLGTNVYILRLPRVITDNGHHGDFKNHIANWKYVEDRPVSIVRTATLLKAVRTILQGSVPVGVYNIATEVVSLPEIAAQYGAKSDTIPADSMAGLGPWPVLNTDKAERYGLI